MPPKSPKSAKKKLTKAEKEKLKKDDMERKLQEEEEAKARAEQEEVEKRERDKLEEEERRRMENEVCLLMESMEREERKKRKGQLHELDSIWLSYRNTLLTQQSEQRKQSKWARYMQCDGSPDPTVPGEINTYINMWHDRDDHADVEGVLMESKLAIQLLNELNGVITVTPEEELTEHEIITYNNTVISLQDLLRNKMDLASHGMLLRATDLADPESANLQQVIKSNDITLCVWGNLSKNPRIKSFEFLEKGFSFDIPRLLTLSDCAVRVLFTQFDHYSMHSKSYMLRHKTKIIDEPEEEEKKEEVEEDGEKKEGEEGVKEEGDAEEGLSREQTEVQEEDGEEEELLRLKEDEDPPQAEGADADVMAALQGIDDEEDADAKPEEEEKPPEEPMEEDYEIKTPEPEDWEDFDGDEDAVDLRAYHVLGGTFHFNLLQLPPQPKVAKSWTITQVIDPPALEPFPYVPDPILPPVKVEEKPSTPVEEVKPEVPLSKSAEKEKEKDRKKEEKEKEKKEDKPPITVTLKLPETVYFCEEPQIVRWDANLKQWRLDGFYEHKFDDEKRVLSCKTTHFGTMALMQDAHINMPFQSWELRSRGLNQAQLSIIAAIIEVEIQMKDGMCSLSQPAERAELQWLINKWMTPPQLIQAMRGAGLNVFPAPDSSKYVSIQNKNAITEERLYQQMAMVASGMAYSWSKWNSEVDNNEKIVVQGSEHLIDEALLEEDWSLFLVTKKRTTKLKMTEFDETFSDDHAEGTEFNADLYHMTMEIASEETKERIRQTNHNFVDSVYSLLKGSRLVTYS